MGRDHIRCRHRRFFCISIHAPRVGRDQCRLGTVAVCRISIHAPRVGRDEEFAFRLRDLKISIHAPRVGRDPVLHGTRLTSRYFNPRAPCGARLFTLKWSTAEVKISIHAPRVGRDSLAPEENTDEEEISIHAPRVGRDSRAGTLMHIYTAFQSTRPVWGATIPNYWENTGRQFQSTRPVWGATICRICLSRVPSNFNPRAPCGARPTKAFALLVTFAISIHAPRVGRDQALTMARRICKIFQSTRPVWGATPLRI